MKLAVIGTTINGEKGYLPFDRVASRSKFSDVAFVIAGDKNSKLFDASQFRCRIEYLEPKDQERFAVSETIGWKTPRRRPIAWLRAIELKPDYILSVDDDNAPAEDYFDRWHEILTAPCHEAAVPIAGANAPHWHNYLRTSDAPFEIHPRGFPMPFRNPQGTEIRKLDQVVLPGAIGLWQGISLGDPDMDAMTRLVYPKHLPLTEVGEKNYVLRDVWSPYNMQNTMFARTLFPLPILWPHAQRYDDIYASFVWQKFLFNNGRYVYVGDPVNIQDRGVRDILRTDFKEELDGYRESHDVWREIDQITETDPVKFSERLLACQHHAIAKNREFFRAYLQDLKTVLA